MKSYSNPVSVTFRHPTSSVTAFQWNKYNGRLYMIWAGSITPIEAEGCRYANSRADAEARIKRAFNME